MISNQSRGLNKGPGRLLQTSIGLRTYALMEFAFFVSRVRKHLIQARHRDGWERELLLTEARADGLLAREWYQTAMESGVAA